MMQCSCCGHEIKHINAPIFNHDGSDSYCSFDFYELEEVQDEAVIIELPKSWGGYELSDDEKMECILCPNCGRFPFSEPAGINVETVVRAVCFKERKG